jgi:diguanylate cyclase (GGDEF)-like protein
VRVTPSTAASELPEIRAHLAGDPGPGALDRARLLEAIAFQSEVAGAGAGANATMRVVTERAQHLTEADGALFELADGDEMISQVVTGAAEASLGAVITATADMSRLAVTSGEVQTCPDSRVDLRVDRKACRRVGLRSILCVPVSHRYETVGVLKVFSTRSNAFDETDIAVLRMLAGTVAAAMTQAQLVEQLGALARTDPLTGLPNRGAFEEEAWRQLAFARRQGHPLCFGLLDLNADRRHKDVPAPTSTDQLLRETSTRWRGVLRTEDLLGRWRDKELAILLPNCTTKNAVQLCWRLREEAPAGQTFSAGLVAYQGTETVLDLVARADACLSRAKAKGRDRTVAEGLVDID